MSSESLAAQVRALVERFLSVDVPPGEAAEIEAELATLTRRMESMPPRSRWFETEGDLGFIGYLSWSPLAGALHPFAPPMVLERGEGGIVAKAAFGRAYEGPPGCVHGGFLAAAFDEVLGAAQALTGAPGYTGTLSVRYRKPTPLDTELVFHGVVNKVVGRRIHTSGSCRAGHVVTAEAEAVFISVRTVTPGGSGGEPPIQEIGRGPSGSGGPPEQKEESSHGGA